MGGTAIRRIVLEQIRSLPIPVAPLAAQKAIADYLDEVLSDLDASLKALTLGLAKLKRYRQAVLKAAVEGGVSREWREARRGEIEPAAELLKRIFAERRRRWEKSELTKMRAKGIEPKDEKWKTKYPKRAEAEEYNLPDLPREWAWATLDQIRKEDERSLTDGPFGSNLKTEHYTVAGPRVLRLQNIAPCEFVDEKAHISEDHFRTLKNHAIYPGDIAIRSLGKPAPIACLIPEQFGTGIVKADCIRFSSDDSLLDARYAMYALNSQPVQNRAAKLVHGLGRPRLGLGEIRKIPLPLPPREEQNVIASEIDHVFSAVRALEETIARSLRRAVRLRQAILEKAFRGELVPRDPNDEPAAVLLERLRAHHLNAESPGERVRKAPVKPAWVG